VRTPRAERDRVKARLLTALGADVKAMEQEGFDIDAITERDLDEPQRPEAYYDLLSLDHVIRRPELLRVQVQRARYARTAACHDRSGVLRPARLISRTVVARSLRGRIVAGGW
jgi:hypothetical protein